MDTPLLPADELLRRVRVKGGRPFRMLAPPAVYVLTNDEKLAGYLFDLGARSYSTRNLNLNGSYKRAKGGLDEWDLRIDVIPVEPGKTLWEACAR